MPADVVAQAINLILAPVVMVSACALLLNGFLARYAAINDRLRTLARERFEIWRALGEPETGGPAQRSAALERLEGIDLQAPLVLRHHRLMHDAALIAYCAVLLFVVSMVVIAAVVLTASDWLAGGALMLFLAGTAVLLLSILVAASEVRTSHVAVAYEMDRVLRLTPNQAPQRAVATPPVSK